VPGTTASDRGEFDRSNLVDVVDGIAPYVEAEAAFQTRPTTRRLSRSKAPLQASGRGIDAQPSLAPPT